jgi:hypothetical protein
MVIPTTIIAALSESSPVQATSYLPNCGVLYYKGDIPCGYLPKDVIIDSIHSPKLQSYIQQNSSIDESLCDNIHWAAHSTALAVSNIECLLPTIKFIHNEWQVGLTLENCYGGIAGCPHCGEEETIEHVFTCENVPMIRARELAFDNIWKSLDITPSGPAWLHCHWISSRSKPSFPYPSPAWHHQTRHHTQPQFYPGTHQHPPCQLQQQKRHRPRHHLLLVGSLDYMAHATKANMVTNKQR